MFWNFFNIKNKTKTSENISFDDSFEVDLNHIDLSDTIELLPVLSGSEKLFLGRFNPENLFSMMDKIGLIRHLKSIGFEKIVVDIDVDENRINYMKLFWKEKSPANQLLDLRVSESSFIPAKKYFEKDEEIIPYNMIVIEWMSAKNPLKKFDNYKPQLPGQSLPGLGILKYCFDMLYIMTKLVFKDGFMDVPDHMYGAIMYSKKYKFFDPASEGILRAVERDLKDYSLSDISWGVITETIIDMNTGQPAVYIPTEQIFCVSGRMKKYFESKKYKSQFLKYYEKKKYSLDYEQMQRKRDIILLSKKIEDL